MDGEYEVAWHYNDFIAYNMKYGRDECEKNIT